ncbi:hypothetical protein BDW59DRAFT_178476 [Aspergillus cavernicola]|uniref:DUF7136 domain-containing protein n=1 Tax=Aspergillus cavernicola TaxID=176166 RepID=A0ABR4IRN3_9EURO
MRFPQASLLLAASMGAIVHATNVVEVDLVFPRNETYAPTEWFPVVFAVQNVESAELLNFRIICHLYNQDDRNNSFTRIQDLRWANWSSADPYLAYQHFSDHFNTEGRWLLKWELRWQSCDVEALTNGQGLGGMFEHYYAWGTSFAISNSAPRAFDLVAATANSTCPKDQNAIAINVTDTTMQAPSSVNWSDRDTCAVTTNSTTPAPTPDPCRVAISADAAASMSAALRERSCDPLRTVNPPDDCPADDESVAQPLAVLGASWLLAASGALGFILMQVWRFI